MPNRPSHTLLIDSDLFLAIRLTKGLEKMGSAVVTVDSSEAAVVAAQSVPPDLILINFGRENLRPLETVGNLRSQGVVAAILGYVSHTRIPDLRPQSKAVGCDLLVANSAITKRLDSIVSRLLEKRLEQAALEEIEKDTDEEE